jgi:acyl-CoA synthetase (AMP-forming)/AMP-acid ligase II
VATARRLQPRKTALRDSRRTLDYAQWDERATRLAQALLGLGLRPASRLALLALPTASSGWRSTPRWRAGLVAIPLNFRLAGAEIAYIVQHCQAQALIAQEASGQRGGGARGPAHRAWPLRAAGRLRAGPARGLARLREPARAGAGPG